MGSSLPSDRTITGQVRDLKRRVDTLATQVVRPEAARSAYDALSKGIAQTASGAPAYQILTTNGGPYGNLATSDFALTDVVTTDDRLYKVFIHTQVAPTGSGSPASGLHLSLMVDVTDTQRLARKRFEGAGANFEETVEGSCLWRPTTGTHDLAVLVGVNFGSGTPVFTFQSAGATTERQFWVEDIGPR